MSKQYGVCVCAHFRSDDDEDAPICEASPAVKGETFVAHQPLVEPPSSSAVTTAREKTEL